MNTIQIARQTIKTLEERYDVYATLSKYSTLELATVETYKHQIHIFEDGTVRMHNTYTNEYKDYKTTQTVIKKIAAMLGRIGN